MTKDHDVAAFARRARRYDDGWRGKMHHDISLKTADLACTVSLGPRRILDVGCGTGFLLRVLSHSLPDALDLAGIDPVEEMVAQGRALTEAERIGYEVGVAEHLPFESHTFDLVVSTTSFDHWKDQLEGLRECHRVLTTSGTLVLVDLFTPWLLPTVYTTHRGHARTKPLAQRLLKSVGFQKVTWYPIYGSIIWAAVARYGELPEPPHVRSLAQHRLRDESRSG